MRKGARRAARLTALLIFALWALSGCQGAQSADGWMIERAHTLTGQMAELARSEAYAKMMTSSPELGDVIAHFAAGEYFRPERVVLIDYPAERVIQLAVSQTDLQPSETVKGLLARKMAGATLGNVLNGREGASVLAATSLLSYGESYVQPQGWPGNTVALLEYPGGYASMVSFSQSGEGVISATAVFVETGETDPMTALTELEGLPELDSRAFTGEALDKLIN